jgi:hypothetical protein
MSVSGGSEPGDEFMIIVCRFCDRRNPPEYTHCAGCGAALSRDPDVPPSADGGISPASAPQGLAAEVLAILQSQGKIAAIKQYREATGAGLRESKEAVEALAEEAGVTPARGSGCAPLVMALLATVCLAGACLVAGAGRWPW